MSGPTLTKPFAVILVGLALTVTVAIPAVAGRDPRLATHVATVAQRSVIADAGTDLVKDINLLPASSDPWPIVDVDSTAFAFGCDGSHDVVLWRSDGTPGGVSRIATVGPCGGVTGAVTLDGQLYFLTYDAVWTSDGTPAGTRIVLGGLDSAQDLTRVGSMLYFMAWPDPDDYWSGWELWKSDGKPDGTAKVIDSYGTQLTDLAGTLFFERGGRLWTSDGTTEGTHLVKRIASNTSDLVDHLVAVGGTLLFTARDETHGTELWKSDGTETGTRMVKDIDPTALGSSAPRSLTAIGSALYFSAIDGPHGRELWTSDGTKAGTRLVKDIRTGTGASNPADLIAVGGSLFFTADDGAHGRSLWTSDGTGAGTKRVSSSVPTRYRGAQQAAVGSTLYFSAKGAGGDELWKSDGTKAGTKRVEDINPSGDSSPRALARVGDKLFFSADNGVYGRELWTSDGTADGTKLVGDLDPATLGSGATGLTRVGSTVFFAADDGIHGLELWKTDGDTGGTSMVKDIRPGPESAFWDSEDQRQRPVVMAGVGDQLYLMADDGVHGNELWMSNGTDAGTRLVRDLVPGPEGSWRQAWTALGGNLLYFTYDRQSGRGVLWLVDGTTGGIVKLRTITAASGSVIGGLTRVGGVAFFDVMIEHLDRYPESAHAYLWKTDGTTDGTVRVTPTDYHYIYELAGVGKTLYFSTDDALWKSDGTAAGTRPVKSVYGGNLMNVGGRLFFIRGDSLWTSDGTKVGTKKLHTFNALTGDEEYDLVALSAVGDTLYLAASDESAEPTDLWKSDGTATGTICIAEGLRPTELRNVGGTLYFSGTDGLNGREVWTSDGTEAGTRMVADVAPDLASSDPAEFTKLGTNVLFVADDGSHGRELMSMPLP